MCGQCPDTARLHHPRAKKDTRSYTGFGQCRLCGLFLDAQLEQVEACSTAEATREHYACVHAFLGGLSRENRGTGGLTETQSRPAGLFTTAAIPGRSAALDVCGILQCSSSPRRRTTRCKRREIPDLRAQGIVYRPLVWTADGRPHPAVTPNRTVCSGHRVSPQRTANVGNSPPEQMDTRNPNGSPPPTKSSHDTSSSTKHISKRTLASRWSHRERERATSYWLRAPPLDGGDDDDADRN